MSLLERMQNHDPNIVKILDWAKVLHSGWEMDNSAWLVQMRDGSNKVLTTSHDSRFETMTAEQLLKKIDHTQTSLTGLQRLLMGVI